MLDRAQRQMEVQTQVASTGVAELTQLRRGDIQLAISSLSAEGGRTADLWADVVARSYPAFGVWDAHFGPAGTVETISNGCGNSNDYQGCMQGECIPATAMAHAEWRAATNDLDTALRRWADAYYPLATAIAAHLGDQAQYDLAMLQIQEALDNGLLDVVSRAEELTMFEDANQDTCVTAPDRRRTQAHRRSTALPAVPARSRPGSSRSRSPSSRSLWTAPSGRWRLRRPERSASSTCPGPSSPGR